MEKYEVIGFTNTTDNASNMTAGTKLSRISHISCAIHTLQLSIEPFVEKSLAELMVKLRRIVGHFNQSTKVRFDVVHILGFRKIERSPKGCLWKRSCVHYCNSGCKD